MTLTADPMEPTTAGSPRSAADFIELLFTLGIECHNKKVAQLAGDIECGHPEEKCAGQQKRDIDRFANAECM